MGTRKKGHSEVQNGQTLQSQEKINPYRPSVPLWSIAKLNTLSKRTNSHGNLGAIVSKNSDRQYKKMSRRIKSPK